VTATVIAAGKAIAILPAGCVAPSAGAAPARIAASDPATGLALLDLATPKAPPAPLAATALADGAALMVAGFSEAGSAFSPAGLNAAPGEAVVSVDAPDQPRIMAPVQPPAAGSAVFDRSGRLAGLVGRSAREPRRFAGVVPLMTHPVISLPRLLQFSGIAAPLPPAKTGAQSDMPRSAGEIVQAVRASLVAVACPR
jgi:Trypsin-like peptidase domain